jgi:hypothetical protein
MHLWRSLFVVSSAADQELTETSSLQLDNNNYYKTIDKMMKTKLI